MPISSIPYHSDSAALFSSIRHLPFACWLDSGKPDSHSGRYDIMAAQPSRRWISEQGQTDIFDYHYDGDRSYQEQYISRSTVSPITLLKQASEALNNGANSAAEPLHDLPFTGGMLAYFSYDLGRQQLDIAQRSPKECQLPDMVSGLYTWAIVQDHQQQCSFLVSLAECEPSLLNYIYERIHQLPSDNSTQALSHSFSIGELLSNISHEQYGKKIAQINEYIHAGDCYQVNFAQCFRADYVGDPYIAYLELRKAMASPFSAFMDLGSNRAILSLSPERFLHIHDGQVLTQPIKGTMARDNDPQTDRNNAVRLQASDKNQAENLMIVDLLRNDLGKNCIPGSIHVPELFTLESFPNVHHLVSSVRGILQSEKGALDLFEGCFPGGSITGAPKKRAMEIIEELEDCQRSIYCGSIAYINTQGNMDSNITIRTIACDGSTLYCWGGGGIVADSEAAEEYQESLTKINKILQVLSQFSHT